MVMAMRLPWMTSRCWIGAVRLTWTALLDLLVVIAILPLNGLRAPSRGHICQSVLGSSCTRAKSPESSTGHASCCRSGTSCRPSNFRREYGISFMAAETVGPFSGGTTVPSAWDCETLPGHFRNA